MSFFKNPEKVEGGQRKLWTSEDDIQNLLTAILRELKILNMHMSEIDGLKIRSSDISE